LTNYLLLSLLFIFGYLSHTDFLVIYSQELDLFELFQLIILATCIFIHLSSKKFFLSLSNHFVFIIRLFIFIFLFYEEISFLTKDSIEIFKLINFQSEVNLHNSNFMQNILFSLPLPFTSHISTVSVFIFVVSIFLFIFGFGSFLPYLKRLRYLYLERNFSIFSFVFLLNISLTALIRESYDSSLAHLLHSEFVEFYIYILFLFDVLQKKKRMKLKLNKNATKSS